MGQHNVTLSIAATTAAGNAVAGLLNGGSLQIYQGLRPPTPDTPVNQLNPAPTLLATFTLPNPAFGTDSDGTTLANVIAAVNAVASGHADWGLALDSGGNPQYAGNCAADNTADIALSTDNPQTGQSISVARWPLVGPYHTEA